MHGLDGQWRTLEGVILDRSSLDWRVSLPKRTMSPVEVGGEIEDIRKSANRARSDATWRVIKNDSSASWSPPAFTLVKHDIWNGVVVLQR